MPLSSKKLLGLDKILVRQNLGREKNVCLQKNLGKKKLGSEKMGGKSCLSKQIVCQKL